MGFLVKEAAEQSELSFSRIRRIPHESALLQMPFNIPASLGSNLVRASPKQ